MGKLMAGLIGATVEKSGATVENTCLNTIAY